MSEHTIEITATDPPRSTLWVSGNHRGAAASLEPLAALATRSRRQPEVVAIDPVAGRAEAYATDIRARGLRARPVEERLERAVVLERERPLVHIVHVDRAVGLLAALDHARAHRYPIAGLLLVRAPVVGVVAFRVALAPDDDEAFADARALFDGIAAVSGRSGSEAILGRGSSAHGAVERRIRDWFGEALAGDVARLAAGLPAEGLPIEAHDGRGAMPVVVLDADAMSSTNEVAERVASSRLLSTSAAARIQIVEITRSPETILRFRSGSVDRRHLVRVGRPADLSRARVEDAARKEVEAARARADRARLLRGPATHQLTTTARSTVSTTGAGGREPARPATETVVGLALAAAAAGLASRSATVDTTD